MKIGQYRQRQRKHVELEQFLTCLRVARVCQRQLGCCFLMVIANFNEALQPLLQGPDLQRISCETYDSAAFTPDLRRACELRAINKKS